MEDYDFNEEEDDMIIREQNEKPYSYQDHIEKIMNFQAITQTSNSELAAEYLQRNNWDESTAAREYYDKLNREDFENARRRAFTHIENHQDNLEAEALIMDHNYYMQEAQYQNANRGPSIFSIAMNYTIFPVAKLTGKVVSYLIPKFVKRATCKVFNYFSPPTPSSVFAETCRERAILNAEFQAAEGTKINFQVDYFINAVSESYKQRKPILLIFGDLMMEEIREILKDLFNDEETVKMIASNFLVFGIETGSAESNALSAEFEIKEIPFFGTIICKSDTKYDLIDNYREEEVELNSFKEYLVRSSQTFNLLLEHLMEQEEEEDPQKFIDPKLREDRRLREQQRIDFLKAQEEDKKKEEQKEKELQEKTKLEQEKIKAEQEKKIYEQTRKELAQSKRNELPHEPKEGSTIKFREPLTGNNFIRKFNKSDKVQILYDYVQSKLDEIQFENHCVNFDLVQSLPFKVFNDKEKTLEEVGLYPSAMLQIKENTDDGEDE